MYIDPVRIRNIGAPISLILGTGDIASAIARSQFQSGWGVVMLRDAGVPVLRRGMAFDDALEDGSAELEGVSAARELNPDALPRLASRRDAVVVANLDLAVVAAAWPGMASVLVDARMRKYALPADLRPLAAFAIGVGPGFIADGNVDIAIETLPGQEGAVVEHGATAVPTGRAVPLGDAAEERFVYAPRSGPWQPWATLGAWVEAGVVVGQLGSQEVEAPISGCVRGIVRAAAGGVSRGSKLLEIDPRLGAPWSGVPPRAERIAAGVRKVVDAVLPVGRARVDS
ncbi:MAG TPA: hypothetical protein VGD75_02730 [Bradyrhizobium sp.]